MGDDWAIDPMKKPRRKWQGAMVAVALILIAAVLLGSGLVPHKATVTVCDKTQDQISTDQGDTFTVEREDLYVMLQPGGVYHIEYTDKRAIGRTRIIHEVELAPDHLQDPAACDERSEAFVLAA